MFCQVLEGLQVTLQAASPLVASLSKLQAPDACRPHLAAAVAKACSTSEEQKGTVELKKSILGSKSLWAFGVFKYVLDSIFPLNQEFSCAFLSVFLQLPKGFVKCIYNKSFEVVWVIAPTNATCITSRRNKCPLSKALKASTRNAKILNIPAPAGVVMSNFLVFTY